ncbi:MULTISPECIES: hypothetical protein [unclassified Sulfurimonas]|uniref:hypothetical protein n=1 Tax=unclassified Sulfurimonas TaxID=2623549 RepID=UPI0025D6ADF2|nr:MULTISPECIES: hypothetical protein [unclassified Sulfurimonas]
MILIVHTAIISFIMYMIYLAGKEQRMISRTLSLTIIVLIFAAMPPHVKGLMVLGVVVYGVISVVFSEDD